MGKITTEELDIFQFGRVLHKRPEEIQSMPSDEEIDAAMIAVEMTNENAICEGYSDLLRQMTIAGLQAAERVRHAKFSRSTDRERGAIFLEGYFAERYAAGDRVDPVTGKIININDQTKAG